MTDIRSLIATVIATHSVCTCGEWAENFEEHCAHIADVLVTELGLTWETNEVRQTRLVSRWGTLWADTP